ncbi:non-canonical purine NTP pyrophosphatase [Bifidobacterium sp.]|jgi:XTP/dITP diphosphohydrolase|uniref:non-canonical purine NTP pyrophosphatase n=1 Tax=Bifidobacterium sp. TaxID=41200 RepID=UPI0025C29680|nr:non-canonical purine NTP pyrophosphatase [Bifidobacterium sp.]MCH4208898.1 non-canonical purine NTP pyrophosphatase [Bifidobacterium sp.]MCI1224445.1 non-canonical purine NTP pyrophosphatase [Bifidobacterium sp.]
MRIVVATHNEGKLFEIRRIMQQDLGDLAQKVELVSAGSLGLPDPVETGASFAENALLKARDVAGRTGLPALADDSGLIVDVLGAAPGILSARWSGVHGDDQANNALLLAQLADIPDVHRTARFRCAAALAVPEALARSNAEVQVEADSVTYDIAVQYVETGDMPGRIIRSPRGEHGFGYDPLFVPDDQPNRTNEQGEPLTSAEMVPTEKNAISHRGKAIAALMPDIERLLG